MKVFVHAHQQFTPGMRIFARNNGKDFTVSDQALNFTTVNMLVVYTV